MSPHNDLIPNWIDPIYVIGTNLIDQNSQNTPNSRYASPSNTTSANPKYMLYGKISRMLFKNEHQHFLRLIARLENSNFHDTMLVFTVKIVIKSATDGTESAFDAKMNKGIDYCLYLNESIAAVDTISKTFRKRDFDGTNYSSLLVNDLRLNFRGYDPVGKVIEIGVLYEDYIPVFIDKLYMYDSLFNIYYTNSGIYNSVKSVLDTIIAKSGNDYYESVYCDEPYLMNAKIRKDFTQYLKITTDQKMEINGAAGAYWKWHLLADREFGKQDFTNFYRHYLIYDNYPLHLTTPMGYERQDLLQQSFENMILYRNEGVIPDAYTDHYQHMGFFPSLLGSMNDTPEIDDDIPLIQTIQVSAIRYIEESGGIAVYQDHPHNRRSPTREELSTMFNLALAYGAKGMMYYMVPTRIDPFRQINHPIQVNATIGTYGLFDNPGSGYQNLDNGNTAYQSNSSEQQIPNSRYFALRELINKTKPIEKFILRSHWINGYKADADTTKYRINNLPLSEWISSISSIVRGEEVEDEIPYIEAGLFSYTTDPSQGIRSVIPDTLLIFIVNKFCDDTDSNETTKVRRNVKVKLNPLNLPYDNFSVINLSDSTYPIIAHLADSLLDSSRYFTLPLYGGEGNLIMITPTIYSGGEFRRAETIYKNETIKKQFI